jgi:CheY-like chemotaxis protein
MKLSTSSHPASSVSTAPVVLNVEDFAPSRFLRTRAFRAAGYEVIEAASAGEALSAATQQRPSIALIDVNLPDSSGIALCDTLRRLHPELPVLLISAVSLSQEIQEAGLAAGASGYLGEPIPSDALISFVQNALAGRPAQQQSETWVVTDVHGIILETSALGARLLSGTPRGLQRRNLLVFFEQDRDAWREAMARATVGERVFRSGRLRPKERRPVMVRAEVCKAPDINPPVLVWSFQTEPAASR